MVEFFDLRDQERVTRKMYIVCDKVNAKILNNGKFYCEDFEIRFIQMIPDEYMT